MAYLDGELEGEAARPSNRNWPSIPTPAPRPTFSRPASEYARLSAEVGAVAGLHASHADAPGPPPPTTSQPTLKQRRPWWRPGILEPAGRRPWCCRRIGGYAGYNRLAPRKPGDAELVRNLSVIKNERVYELVEDIDFVRELDQPDLFGSDSPGPVKAPLVSDASQSVGSATLLRSVANQWVAHPGAAKGVTGQASTPFAAPRACHHRAADASAKRR